MKSIMAGVAVVDAQVAAITMVQRARVKYVLKPGVMGYVIIPMAWVHTHNINT